MKTELNTHAGLVRIGTRIRIISLNNGNSPVKDADYNGREGEVTSIDDAPSLHGTWGGLAVYDTDNFKIINP